MLFTPRFLVVEETDSEGRIIKRERRRYANAAMTACRRAWFVGIRAQEKLIPATNPFSNMGLRAGFGWVESVFPGMFG